jgi:hypothetical protein
MAQEKKTIIYYDFIFNIGFGVIRDFYPSEKFGKDIVQWVVLLPFVRLYWSTIYYG